MSYKTVKTAVQELVRFGALSVEDHLTSQPLTLQAGQMPQHHISFVEELDQLFVRQVQVSEYGVARYLVSFRHMNFTPDT